MSSINKLVQFSRPRANGRNPSRYPTDGVGMPMRITRMFPLKLKDVTLDTLKDRQKSTEIACVSELMTLFDCFEKSDYNASVCQQQAAMLENCYTTHMNKKASVKMERRIQMAKNKLDKQ